MSRHRIVRSMDYNDEYDGYDDVYGHSVDDDSCISPSDAQQWLYDRARGQQSMSSFIATHRDIEEEDEELDEQLKKTRRDSEDFRMPVLNDEDQARLLSCMEEIRNVVGESVSERQLVDTVLKYNFDCAKSLDAILNSTSAESAKNKNIEKPSKETVEKDYNPSSLSDLLKHRNVSTNKFELPDKNSIFSKQSQSVLSDSPKSFNKLSDFTNFYLRRSSGDENISEQKSVQETSLKSNSNLANLIPITNTTFVIPKLTNSPKSDDMFPKSEKTLTPHEMSLKKIMDIKRLSISDGENLLKTNQSPITSDQFVIDLSSALRTDDIPIITPKHVSMKDDFIPTFIDCDIKPILLPIVTGDCEIDISSIVDVNFMIRTRKISNFGKILCSKYRCKLQPYVKHEFVHKNAVEPFYFVHPSPDDVISRQIARQ